MWLAILELTVTADYRNAPFRVFGKREMAKTREQRTKLRKRGLKRGKGRGRRAKVRGKRGKIWGRVR